LPVAALDRARQLEVVVDHTAHERVERLGWHGGLREQLAGHPTESDEVVRGDHRARVVERAEIIRKREGPDPEEDGELVRDRTGLLRLAGDGRPGAVELLWATVVGERLQRVEGEAASMRVARCQGRAAAHVRHPGAGRDRRRDLDDHAVGDAEEDELGVALAERYAPLGEARSDGTAHAAARTDDVDALDHVAGSSSLRIPGSMQHTASRRTASP